MIGRSGKAVTFKGPFRGGVGGALVSALTDQQVHTSRPSDRPYRYFPEIEFVFTPSGISETRSDSLMRLKVKARRLKAAHHFHPSHQDSEPRLQQTHR